MSQFLAVRFGSYFEGSLYDMRQIISSLYRIIHVFSLDQISSDQFTPLESLDSEQIHPYHYDTSAIHTEVTRHQDNLLYYLTLHEAVGRFQKRMSIL
ncbi:hypothetical protein BY996DRAFT_6568670, partial [Phakopsora pachyrhizi]